MASIAMPIESPECEALRKCHVVLIETLSLSINSIGDALFAKGLVPPDLRIKIQSSGNTIPPNEKAREILSSLSIQIKHDPKIFQKFVEVLTEEGPWAEFIVEKLTSCYKSLRGAQQTLLKCESAGDEKLHLKFTVSKDFSEEVLRNIHSVQLSVNYKDQVCVRKSLFLSVCGTVIIY